MTFCSKSFLSISWNIFANISSSSLLVNKNIDNNNETNSSPLWTFCRSPKKIKILMISPKSKNKFINISYSLVLKIQTMFIPCISGCVCLKSKTRGCCLSSLFSYRDPFRLQYLESHLDEHNSEFTVD